MGLKRKIDIRKARAANRQIEVDIFTARYDYFRNQRPYHFRQGFFVMERRFDKKTKNVENVRGYKLK